MSMHRIITAGAVALFVGATPAQASLSRLNANWYTLPSNHVDVNVSITGTVLGLVENTLGPNGMPVRSSVSTAFPLTSASHILDVAATNEIL
jgi:hypothetical protein